LFGFAVSFVRRALISRRKKSGLHPREPPSETKTARRSPTLFDFVHARRALPETEPPASPEPPSPRIPIAPAITEVPNLAASVICSTGPDFADTPIRIASGEKAKARDILAAVRVLQTLDRNGRLATN